MLFEEFVQGTGCKASEYNYKIYKDLEIMYTNSTLTKAEIYEYGRKLVDNSKTEDEIRLENEILEEIAALKLDIEQNRRFLESDKRMMKWWKEDGDDEMVLVYRRSSYFYRKQIWADQEKIRRLKWVLGE